MPPDQDNNGTSTTAETSEQSSLVHAPLMPTNIFPTWEDFAEYLDEYQRQTFQVYVYKTSTSATTRNQRISQLHDKKSEKNTQLMPLELKYYAKTLICTYGGKPQYRGKGLRPHQNRRPMECPARMNVVVKRKPGNCDTSIVSGWRIVVTQHRAIHNHPLNAETFMVHPRNRKVEDPMVLEAVNALRKAGVKRGAIRKYITEKEPNKNVTSNDVNNLLIKMKNNNFTILPSNLNPVIRVAAPIMGQDGRILDERTRDQTSTMELDDRAQNEHTRVLASTMELDYNGRTREQASEMELSDRTGNERTREAPAPGLSYCRSGEGQDDLHDARKAVNSLQGLIETSTESFRLRVRQDPKHVDAGTIHNTNALQYLRNSSASREDEEPEHDDTGTVNGTDSFQGPEMTSGGSQQRVNQDSQDIDPDTTNDTTSLERLRDSNEMTSGSFRLRTSRLEEQNLQLYAQNTKLAEQNRQYVAYLDEARKKISRQDAMLMGLRKSNVILTKSMREQSQEIARLKAENAKLMMQTRQHKAASDMGGSTTSQP